MCGSGFALPPEHEHLLWATPKLHARSSFNDNYLSRKVEDLPHIKRQNRQNTDPMIDLTTTLCGESVVLMPERTMLIERTRTLLVADVHLGKDTAFRIAGIPIPGDTTADSLARLSSALERSQARRLIFLGDLVHARTSLDAMTVTTIQAWRERHREIEMLLVPGNHDARSGALPPDLQIETTNDELTEPPFVFKHHPEASPYGYALAGHIHPAIRLTGRGRQKERVACFLFRNKYGVLPAFGTFTGGFEVGLESEDRVFTVTPSQIVEVHLPLSLIRAAETANKTQ